MGQDTPQQVADRQRETVQAVAPSERRDSFPPARRMPVRVGTLIKGLLTLLVVGMVIYRVKYWPVAVEAVPAVRGSVVAEVMGTGTLEAHTSAAVGSKIPGRIVELKADQNDPVKKGQILAMLDDAELKSQVEVAASALQTAQATLVRVKTDMARAEAVLELARINEERAAKLQTQSAAAQLEVDTSRERLKVAQADVQRATAAIEEAQHQVVTAENTLRYQQTLLDNATILSPFDGVIVRRDHNLGDVVTAGASIFQIVATEELWASVWVDETAMANLSPGQPARIIFRSQPGKEYPGKVVRLGREVDRQTREFLVDIEMKEVPANWAVGQRVDAYVATGRKDNVIGLSYRLIAWKANQPGVYIAEDGQAQWQPLQLGLKGLSAVEVVEGLSEGQTVVIAPASGGQPTPLDGRRITLP